MVVTHQINVSCILSLYRLSLFKYEFILSSLSSTIIFFLILTIINYLSKTKLYSHSHCVYFRLHTYSHALIYIRGAFIRFPDFFVQVFKIVVDSWTFSMLLLYILRDDRPILMISALNEQLQQQFEYTLLKPDCHSWWISKMQSDTLEERFAIKFCFKLKMPQKRIECFRLLLNYLPWIEHRFLSGIRDSRKAGSQCVPLVHNM